MTTLIFDKRIGYLQHVSESDDADVAFHELADIVGFDPEGHDEFKQTPDQYVFATVDGAAFRARFPDAVAEDANAIHEWMDQQAK